MMFLGRLIVLSPGVCAAALTLAACASTSVSPVKPEPSRVVASVKTDLKNACGGPLVEARLGALNLGLKGRGNVSLEQGLQVISRSTLDDLQLYLGQLSERENQLVQKVNRMPLPIVHRVPFPSLRAILNSGALISPEELALRETGSRQHVRTPAIEDSMFGGHHCVFTTVGPPEGFDRYGDVIVRFNRRTSVPAWGQPSSGFGFIKRVRNRELTREATFDEKLHYSMTVVTESDFEKFMGLGMIAFLREKADGEYENLIRSLLDETAPSRFWSLVERHKLGYLEGKYEGAVPLDDVEAIEVPSGRMNEVRGWSESRRWRGLIQGY